MMFYILFVMVFVVPVVCFFLGALADDWQFNDFAPFSALMGFVLSVPLFALPVLLTWSDHAEDVAKVVAQHHRIDVYQARIDSLSQRLSEANYPDKPIVSLDSDTPWATMMIQLSEAESELAGAKDERARAIRSIEARKRGPMSGVVSFVGDYE